MSVQVSNLTKMYGSQKAVNNINFSIHTGEVVGFLGPNGAGKSTTMKMLTGFIKPTSGTAEVCGLSLADNSLEARKKVGYLPESNPLYYDMYVKEYLNFAANVYHLSNKKQKIASIIEQTGLGKEQHKTIGQLSKGYKQRVGLAQSMLHNPEVLILDEPTSGLDPNQLVDIRNLIIELGKEKTVILSTHIMQEVEAMCSRVLIINEGNIVANDLIVNNNNQKTSKQIVRFKTNKPLGSFGKVLIEKSINGFYEARSKDTTDLRAVIFNEAVRKNVILLHLEEHKESIEDKFKEVTNR